MNGNKKRLINYPKVTIIVPLYVIEKRFFRDLKKFKILDYPNYEMIVVCDKQVEIKKPKVKFILTKQKRTGPAEKRDIALKYAKGDLCAFIDDDAYPDKNWLKNAIIHFNHPKIAAVGGPGLTPKEDSYWEKITGLIYLSPLCGGPTQHRFTKTSIAFVDDYPAYNLIIRKDVLKSVGGYGSHFYGGEDTFLCLKLVKKGWNIIYDPEVAIYHHRRALIIPYWKQISNIGKHRGYFAKRFPETSLKLFYFLPSIVTIGFVVFLIASFFNIYIRMIFLFIFISSIFISFASIINKATAIEAIFVSFGIILTHISYGLAFIRGLLTKNIKR